MSFIYADYNTIEYDGNRFYDLGTICYPSITTVLGNTEDSGWLEAWHARVGIEEANRVSKAATTRGTNVHLMLERFCQGADPGLQEFPEEHQRVFKSMTLEARKINKIYGQEVALYSTAFEVAGRCDVIGEWQGVPSIIDFKTANKPKRLDDIRDYWLQTTFYALAHNEMFKTDIKQLVVFIGVEERLPQVFKATITDDLIVELAERTSLFYDNLGQQA